MRQIVVIAHNLRSAHNVGSLLRTAEGLAINKVFLTGYTPSPMHEGDSRMPHLANKIHNQITKTALGAENMVDWEHKNDVMEVFSQLITNGHKVYALEQTPKSVKLSEFPAPDKIAIILGREVEGIEEDVLNACDGSIEIPMLGKKESFNVVQAAAMAMYHFRFM